MHAFPATRYLLINHVEASPRWDGLLGSLIQDKFSLSLNCAHKLIGWDSCYGFPLLHNYQISEGIIMVCGSIIQSCELICYTTDWVVQESVYFWLGRQHSQADQLHHMCICARILAAGLGCQAVDPVHPQQHIYGNLDQFSKSFPVPCAYNLQLSFHRWSSCFMISWGAIPGWILLTLWVPDSSSSR